MKDYIIFESKNEKDELKADLIAKSAVGSTWITRRKIDEDDICAVCKNKKSVCEKAGKTSSHLFFPAKYAIGRKLFVAKRDIKNWMEDNGDNHLCECGHEGGKHSNFSNSCQETEPLCTCEEFKPILLEITGGVWHKQWWLKTMKGPASYKSELGRSITRLLEAELEGFWTWQGMLKAFEENKKKWGDIEKSWRVELKRIL